ncbi:DUF4179 domain-containing protein [Saccharibacillus deserti]|uniref:DUF4179 domain-containing protein n=1 Tax=Saccharibacillus deserti TaxID=1634444 RepID=UPI001551B6A9|nr:DUF4179 domain-containing protein [Saccharibacillus deserti]
MTKREEEKLARDAEQMDRDSRQVGQMELKEAVKKGIVQGRKRSARHRTVYGTGAAAAAAAAIIALSASLMPGADGPGEASDRSAVTAAAPQVPESAKEKMKDYRGIGMDSKYYKAIQGGHMSSLNQTVKKDGYTLTLRGEAMDERRMLVAFSLKNETDQPVFFQNTNVDFGTGIYTKWLSTDMAASPNVAPGATGTYFSEIQLSPGTNYPEAATFQTTVVPGEFGKPVGEKTAMEVPFKAHPQALNPQIETVKTEAELVVAGQRIRVENLEISPIGIYLDYVTDTANDKRIFSLIEPKLTVKNKSQTESPNFLGKESGANTLIFDSVKLENRDSILFSVSGISAVDPDQTELIINTATGEILKGNPNIKAAVDPDKKTLELHYTVGEYNDFVARNAVQFNLGETFTDAEGKAHKLVSNSMIREKKEDKLVESTVFKLEEEKIAQPAVLEITAYWQPIMEPQEIEIK